MLIANEILATLMRFTEIGMILDFEKKNHNSLELEDKTWYRYQ